MIHGYYLLQHKKMPEVWSADDARVFIDLAKEVNASHNNVRAASHHQHNPWHHIDLQFAEVTEEALTRFAYTCQGNIAPMTAALGGWVAQEALKGLTGKFSPLEQFVCIVKN